jgi:hypothetical protein
MACGHSIEDQPPIEGGWCFWNGCMFDRAAEALGWLPLPDETPCDLLPAARALLSARDDATTVTATMQLRDAVHACETSTPPKGITWLTRGKPDFAHWRKDSSVPYEWCGCVSCNDARGAVNRQAEPDTDAQDAARYRWLAEIPNDRASLEWCDCKVQMDEHIDSRLRSESVSSSRLGCKWERDQWMT